MTRLVPELPAQAPCRHGYRITRWIGRTLLRLGGWKVVGEWPDVAKLVVIAAPHSSAWDAVWGIATIMALDLRVVFIGKKEAFWGPVGWLLRRFGGMPVDRSAPAGVVDQVAQQIRHAERMWFVLAPEGTRRKVEKWKTGFWKIAKRADAPVFCAWFHYPDRIIGLGPLVELTDDMDADIARIRRLFAGYQGKHRKAD